MQIKIFAVLLTLGFTPNVSSAQSQNTGAVGRGVNISFQNADNSKDRGVSIRFYDGGTLTVAVAPTAATAATFSITPTISSFPTSAPAPVSRSGILPGQYQITFGDIAGWTTPSPQQFNITANQTTSIVGAYTPKVLTGTATVRVTLNTPAGGFTMTSTNGLFAPLTCPGSVICTDIASGLQVPTGSYTVQFKPVSGTFTPLPQKLTLASGQSSTFQAYYRRLFVVGFTGFANAPFSTTGEKPHCLLRNGGSGRVQYSQSEMSQDGYGVPKSVLNALNDPQLKSATQAASFTFYDLLGDACNPPATNDDHAVAGHWLQNAGPFQQPPSQDDWIAVIGHSYGGNRARLFVDQVQRQIGRPVDLLVTIDPVEWGQCNILNAFLNTFTFDPSPCLQTFLTLPATSARINWGFFQRLGLKCGADVPVVLGCPSGLYTNVLDGYVPLNAVSFKQVNAGHTEIDTDSSVQAAISNMFLTASTGARMSAAASGQTRSGTVISVPFQMTLQPMVKVTGLTLTAATLNGVPSSNLAAVSLVGDVNVGSSRTVTFLFPGSAGASGTNVALVVQGVNDVGQTVTFPSLRVTLP